MRPKFFLVGWLLVPVSIGHAQEFADEATSRAVSDIYRKLARISSYYLEYSRTDPHSLIPAQDFLKTGAMVSENHVEVGRIWYWKPWQARTETTIETRTDQYVRRIKYVSASDGHTIRRVAVVEGQKTARGVREDLDRLIAEKYDLDLLNASVMSFRMDILRPFARQAKRARVRLVGKRTVGTWPCLQLRVTYPLPPGKTEGGLIIDLFFRLSDGVLVREARPKQCEWVVNKIMLNCNFPPGTFVFNPKALGLPYTEVDHTDSMLERWEKQKISQTPK